MYELTVGEYEDTQSLGTFETRESALVALGEHVLTHDGLGYLYPHITQVATDHTDVVSNVAREIKARWAAKEATAAVEYLAEHRERLVNAAAELSGMGSARSLTTTDGARLAGKADGVELALSYLDEITR